MMIDVQEVAANKYEVRLGDKCLIHMSLLSLLSKSVLIQFELLGALTRSELRWMKSHFGELVDGTTAICNVFVNDPVALRFAEAFGFKITETIDEVYLLKRES